METPPIEIEEEFEDDMQGPIYYEGDDDVPVVEKVETEEEKFEDLIEHGYYDEKTLKNPHMIAPKTKVMKASKQSMN